MTNDKLCIGCGKRVERGTDDWHPQSNGQWMHVKCCETYGACAIKPVPSTRTRQTPELTEEQRERLRAALSRIAARDDQAARDARMAARLAAKRVYFDEAVEDLPD